MIKNSLITFLILIIPNIAIAQDPTQAARDAADQAMGRYGNISGLQENVFKPLEGQANMTNIEGTNNFNSQITCSQAQEFLEVTMQRGAAGDISSLNVQWDADLDGVLESAEDLAALTQYGAISGVCTNGFISCEIGTWNNCRAYDTQYTAGIFTLNWTPVTNMQDCYCINQGCAAVLLSDADITDTASDALFNAFKDMNRSFMLSHVDKTADTARYYGQEPTSCFSSSVGTLAGLYDNPFMIENEAQNETILQQQDPQSFYSLLSSTYQNQMDPSTVNTCTINRAVNESILDIYEIIEPLGGTGSVTSCGQFCIQIILGNPADNWLCAGCQIYEFYYDMFVHRPEKISSAIFEDAYYDDHMQIWIGDLAGQTTSGYCSSSPLCIWAGPDNNFPPETPGACEHQTSFYSVPNQNLTGYFSQAGPLQTKLRVSVSGCGEGYARIRVTVSDWCEMAEAVQDNCQIYETDPDCRLKEETIDGVVTVKNFVRTGSPVYPSAQQACSTNVVHDWWSKERTYMCKSDQTFDFTDVKQRLSNIYQGTSRQSNTFTYGDYYLNQQGQWTSYSSGTLNMQQPPTVNSCVEVCRVKSLKSDTDVSSTGNTTNYNVSTDRYEYSYKPCDNGTCEVGAGETLVDACSCTTNFNEAFTAMQLLRLAGEDIECAQF